MTDQAKDTAEAIDAWWAALRDNEREMWLSASPTRDAAGAYEIFQREKDEIRRARSLGSTAGDRAIGKRHNPYDAHVQPHLHFYWDWLYEETWQHR